MSVSISMEAVNVFVFGYLCGVACDHAAYWLGRKFG